MPHPGPARQRSEQRPTAGPEKGAPAGRQRQLPLPPRGGAPACRPPHAASAGQRREQGPLLLGRRSQQARGQTAALLVTEGRGLALPTQEGSLGTPGVIQRDLCRARTCGQCKQARQYSLQRPQMVTREVELGQVQGASQSSSLAECPRQQARVVDLVLREAYCQVPGHPCTHTSSVTPVRTRLFLAPSTVQGDGG